MSEPWRVGSSWTVERAGKTIQHGPTEPRPSRNAFRTTFSDLRFVLCTKCLRMVQLGRRDPGYEWEYDRSEDVVASDLRAVNGGELEFAQHAQECRVRMSPGRRRVDRRSPISIRRALCTMSWFCAMEAGHVLQLREPADFERGLVAYVEVTRRGSLSATPCSTLSSLASNRRANRPTRGSYGRRSLGPHTAEPAVHRGSSIGELGYSRWTEAG